MNDYPTILYVRYYERIDDAREMITKKYYDLGEEYDLKHDEKIGDIYPLYTFLDDIESAAEKK